MNDNGFQSFVDEVIEHNDITDVISEYAKLKRVGNRFAALCPLHNDKKSPSLSISPDKQLFHCFGCGAGGNVINFIMAAEHLDFMDALKYLADRAKLPIPNFENTNTGPQIKDTDKKQLIFEINREAAKYFYSNLAGEKGRAGLAYLKDRGIKNSTIKMFGLGYAPEGWTSLIDHLKAKGYKEHDIYVAGLAKMRDNGTYYDAFYDGRVMFPIINVQGNIIGFGGRIITNRENTGKYLNTPETLVFKKKENLFGLNIAKNNRAGQLLLMEGYMDVISLHQAGITNAVASLGTAFTPEQAKLVKRYGGKAVLCYDSDEAGRKATLKAGEILMASGIKTKVLTLTDGKDPDEFIKAKGGEMFSILVENAKSLVEYKIDEIQRKYTPNDGSDTPVFSNTEKQLEFAEAAAEILSGISSPIEYEIYVKQVSEKSGISSETLNAAVLNLRRQKAAAIDREEEQRQRRLQNGELRSVPKDKIGLVNAEQLLLSLVCDKAVFKIAKEHGIKPDMFTIELHKKIAGLIFKMYEDVQAADFNRILSMVDDNERGKVSQILMKDKNIEDKKKACLQPINTILAEHNLKRQAALLKSGNLEELNRLLKQSGKPNKSERNGGSY